MNSVDSNENAADDVEMDIEDENSFWTNTSDESEHDTNDNMSTEGAGETQKTPTISEIKQWQEIAEAIDGGKWGELLCITLM
jgi:hypothetical protein